MADDLASGLSGLSLDDENRGELKLNKVDHLLPAISKIYDDMTKENPIAKSKMMDE
jgi:hypothetical protein